ncbi:hypothetical protein [Niabella ginsengisoli]|uniref:Ribosome maturation factor RimM n=1 Tax=Niabella ginsengisoli TaxID=522298 RepID=A0ABS9SJY3_9BACT|nr:hypothetical protein [Niabella ginsengisoli]MCH5598626.1 hypothetical protein [Niabella ginsengisoli]
MKKKKYIGQLVSVKFKDRKTPIYGYVVDYNDDWTLMKYNPVDYIIDGYVIFRHNNIEGFSRNSDEKWKEKVINLKGLQPTDKDIIPLSNLGVILKYLTDNFGIFQVYTKSETSCYLGQLKSIDKRELILDNLQPNGKWKGEIKFRTDNIRIIEFDTDYINSLKLISTAKKTKK